MLFETILLIDGVPQHLEYHQERMDRSRRQLTLDEKPISLVTTVVVPKEFACGHVRCRVDYSYEVLSVVFSPVVNKTLHHLIVTESNIEYSHKWSNRGAFDALRALYPSFDDVIITKSGFLTDCTSANLALFDGDTWVTPSTPLLLGTTRARLLLTRVIRERAIHRRDLVCFEKIVLINALRGFDQSSAIEISNVVF